MTNIAVVMSTYNGVDFLIPQLESIFSQRDVYPHLFVRDDASQDGTVQLIRNFARSTKYSISVMESGVEGNLGPYGSWDLLLREVPKTFDFYAIADQDDIWLESKLSSSVAALSECEGPAVSTCGTTAIGASGKIIKEYTFNGRPTTLESLFVRFSIPGHTIVFNKVLFEMLGRYNLEKISNSFSLEPRILTTCLSCGGVWNRDSSSYVLWRRQTGHNVTVSGHSVAKRIENEWARFCSKDSITPWAEAILSTFPNEITDESREFLETVVSAKSKFRSRINLVRSPKFTSGIPACDLIARFRVLLPRW